MKTQKYLLEIEKKLSRTIREQIKSGASVSEQKLLSMSLDHLKRLYTEVPDNTDIPKKLFCWRSSDLDSVIKMWNDIKPDIEKHISETIKACRSMKMVTEIRQFTAQSLIKEAMDEAGLKCLIVPQTYRAKVAVRLGRNNKFVFYISYKRTAEDLERCIPAVKTMIETMDSLGSLASIQKMQAYENW
jgi:hypothetical protein